MNKLSKVNPSLIDPKIIKEMIKMKELENVVKHSVIRENIHNNRNIILLNATNCIQNYGILLIILSILIYLVYWQYTTYQKIKKEKNNLNNLNNVNDLNNVNNLNNEIIENPKDFINNDIQYNEIIDENYCMNKEMRNINLDRLNDKRIRCNEELPFMNNMTFYNNSCYY